MIPFKLNADFKPAGDQGSAIDQLANGLEKGKHFQTLKGVTGSGKTFTMANVIQKIQRPALILSHNKTLAAQLYREFKDFFPDNAVEYFVSYYDYYQPEAYLPSRDLYIEKDSSINEEIDRLRLSATASLIEREDVIVVSSVSCIYGLGNPVSFKEMRLPFRVGNTLNIEDTIRKLVSLQYQRNDMIVERGNFRVRGEVLEIYPAYMKDIYRIELDWDTIARIRRINPVSGKTQEEMDLCVIYPAKHFVLPEHQVHKALDDIRLELSAQLKSFEEEGKLVEAQRLKSRTEYDLDMMNEMGYCSGIENYSAPLSMRARGDRPAVLLDYFPDNYLTFVDESHVSLSQIRAMYNGDRARKTNLVNFGFRLPSALDNRPLLYSEFESITGQTIFVSATPGEEEIKKSGEVVEQLIRPTGLLDPELDVRPTEGQIEDLYSEINKIIMKKERVLVTTLTKKMSEDLTEYLGGLGLKVQYLHSEVDTMKRVEILRDLRLGEYDVLIGVNLLREGLDLPEVSLIAIMDADKVGFLRSATSLIQIIGRAARNQNGRVIMYADKVSAAMKTAMDETSRRRTIQMAYNKEHGITPTTIKKAIQDILARKKEEKRSTEKMSVEMMKKSFNLLVPKQRKALIKALENQMLEHAKNLEFEEAAVLRDEVEKLKEMT